MKISIDYRDRDSCVKFGFSGQWGRSCVGSLLLINGKVWGFVPPLGNGGKPRTDLRRVLKLRSGCLMNPTLLDLLGNG